MNYQCPVCDKPLAYEDSRAGSFLCLSRDPHCRFSVPFNDFRRVARALKSEFYTLEDQAPPNAFNLNEDTVNGIIRTIYSHQKSDAIETD